MAYPCKELEMEREVHSEESQSFDLSKVQEKLNNIKTLDA